MVNRKKIAKWDKELAHDLSVYTDEDYVSEMRFKKCILDAAAKVRSKYAKDVIDKIKMDESVAR